MYRYIDNAVSFGMVNILSVAEVNRSASSCSLVEPLGWKCSEDVKSSCKNENSVSAELRLMMRGNTLSKLVCGCYWMNGTVYWGSMFQNPWLLATYSVLRLSKSCVLQNIFKRGRSLISKVCLAFHRLIVASSVHCLKAG